MDTILPRQDDGAYDVWMSSQADAYVNELDEDDPIFDLAVEIQDAEIIPFKDAYRKALQQLPGCAVFAQDWDMHAWLGGNAAAAAF